MGAVAGLIASSAVGVPVLVDTVGGAHDLLLGPPALWWMCYLGYLAAFTLLSQVPPEHRPARLTARRLLAVQALLGAAAYTLSPTFGWTVVLLVVTAATAAYELSRRATVAIVGVQLLLIAAVTGGTEIDPFDAALSVVIYTSFQLFAVMVIWAQQRETESRAHLAEAHAELRTATALLETSSRSAERLRIARELHDVVGHQLTALALELEVAAHTSEPPGAEHVERARAIAKALLADVRAAVGELRAPKGDLREALETITTGLPRPRIELRVADDVSVDDDTMLALVRCAQEVVTNTVRHADACSLHIEVATLGGGGVRFVARDDGRGARELRPGNGLDGIRERIEGIGGAVRFRAAPGRGVKVVAEIPRR